jgi:rod shape determining protein RodA
MRKFNLRYFIGNYDFWLLILVSILGICGIFAVGSAKASLQNRQMMGVIGGLFIMILLSFLDYHFYLKLHILCYVGNLVLLALVLSSLGDDAGGAQRWLNLGFIRVQPSELAKILLILFFAQFITHHKQKLNTVWVLLLSVILIAAPLFLVYKQPDLSTTIMIAILYLVMMFVGGVSHKLTISLAVIFIPTVLVVFLLAISPGENFVKTHVIKEYQQNRILAWLYPNDYRDTEAYQQLNSKTAIGSGQLLGKGYANNEVSSVKNGNYISQPQTDFIFAVIGEEWGFIGGTVIILMEFLIAMRCFNIARKALDLAGHIIASAMGALILFQSFINISVTTGLLPNTGIPLPLVSYGLTSLMSICIGMGIVLNIRLQSGRI